MTDRVLVVGGGFAGVYAVRRPAGSGAEITLLDRGTSNLFQPLLYQCATGLLSEGQITSPLRALLRRHRDVRVLLGEAHGLDPERRVVTARRPDATTFDLPYDHLVVAAGMRQSYFGHPEFARHAPGMKSIDDALTIRRRVLGAFEMAETLPGIEERREWLTFAITGAGPTGVELAGQIRELALHTIEREFRRIDPAEARVLLFDGGTVLWTAGVEAAPFLATVAEALGATPDGQGRIPVQPDLTVAGHPEVRVVGDVMSLDGLPGVAEVAMQSGHHAGSEIRRRIGDPGAGGTAFRYRDLGSAAYISHGNAVLSVGPVRLSGFAGWVAWGAIHIAFLAGVRNRFTTLMSWLLTLGFRRRAERALTYGDPSTADQPYG
jgi:NADH dehydrogenase